MTPILFSALPSSMVAAWRAGAADANGQPPERHVSDGDGNPCRHCLREIPAGEAMLVLAHRPFASLQPYAETGPIFVCASGCARHPDAPALPAMMAGWERLLMRGYDAEERIVYGTGEVLATGRIVARAAERLADPHVAFLHLRSASNNCYQLRIGRG